MKLYDYIFGGRRGRDANSLEREAMTDPFLADALEGYDSVSGNHADKLTELSQIIDKKASKPKRKAGRRVVWMTSVAAVLLLAIAGTALYLNRPAPIRNTVVADVFDRDVESQVESVERNNAGEMHEAEEAATLQKENLEMQDSMEALHKNDAEASQRTQTLSKRAHAVKVVADAIDVVHSEVLDASVDSSAFNDMSHADDVILPPEIALSLAQHQEWMDAEVKDSNEVIVVSGYGTGRPISDAVSSKAMVIEPRVRVSNPEFDKYIKDNRKVLSDGSGKVLKGKIEVEFRVNESGVPSDISILSGLTPESNREIVEFLVYGPRWEPTDGKMIVIEVIYE